MFDVKNNLFFEDFENEASAKDELKQKCKNVKLFLREPLMPEVTERHARR